MSRLGSELSVSSDTDGLICSAEIPR
jgi:hypothetical protein